MLSTNLIILVLMRNSGFRFDVILFSNTLYFPRSSDVILGSQHSMTYSLSPELSSESKRTFQTLAALFSLLKDKLLKDVLLLFHLGKTLL